MASPDAFGTSVVVTVLRRERALFVDNAKRCRDVEQLTRYQRIIDAFDAQIAAAEQTAQPTPLRAVA